MAKRTRIWIDLGIAAVAAAVTAGCGTGTGSIAGGLAANGGAAAGTKVVPAQGFKDLDGKPVGLAQFKGRPIVISFLSPGNAGSQAQVPLLIRLAGAYQPEGVVFVAAGEQATVRELKEFARQSELPFPVWQDPGAAEFRGRGFTGLPAHQFVDRGGRVLVSRQGYMARGELLEAIAQIL